MSEVVEGILIKPDDLKQVSLYLNEKGLNLKNLDSKIFLVYEDNGRSFSAEFENIAVDLSQRFKKVLLIRYDSRISYRYSVIYEDGLKTDEFGEKDELFVLLHENGYPIKDGDRFTESELDPDEEYETIVNAIQLGLEKMSIDSNRWDELLDLLSQL